MQKYAVLLIFVFCSIVADAAKGYEAEVKYLIESIRGSECTFIRNNKEYSAADAAEHLQMKFNRVRKRIKSAEQFISKVASKSSMSGKHYMIRCSQNEAIKTDHWLTQQLERRPFE